MIPVGDYVANKIVYMTGEIDDPVITRVLVIEEYNETKLDELRRETYALERRGIQRKAGGVFDTYTSASFRSSIIEQRGNIQSQRYNNQFGAERGAGSGGTQKAKSGARSPYTPLVHTFTDIAGKRRNVLKVNSEYI